MAKPTGRPAGRPKGIYTVYTREISDDICNRIAGGESLSGICKDLGISNRSVVLKWVFSDIDGFSERYARAREMQAECFADDLAEIADQSHGDVMVRDGKVVVDRELVARSALRVDTRKWIMARILPKKYGARTAADAVADAAQEIVVKGGLPE